MIKYLSELSAKISRLLAHGLNGSVQLWRGFIAGVDHVLGQQVLQRLSYGVTLRHDTLPPLVSSTRTVRHQSSATDDALQTFLQTGPELALLVVQGVDDHLG